MAQKTTADHFREIGARLRAFRMREYLSQDAFAQSIKVSGELLHSMEEGETAIDPLTLLKIAYRFRVDLHELLTGKVCERHEMLRRRSIKKTRGSNTTWRRNRRKTWS